MRREDGQVLAPVLLALLVFTAAFVIDVGSWYLSQRRLQSAVDAAALAAAAQLPGDTAAATAAAERYAALNGGALASDPVFSTRYLPADTVEVDAEREAPLFFARVVGVEGVTVHAHAVATAAPLVSAARVIPIGVSRGTPVLVCGPACFGETATLEYDRATVGAPGAFAYLDLANARGAVGTPTLAAWVRDGYPDEVPLGAYDSDPGNRWDSGPVRGALDALVAARATVLLPVYAGVSGRGANARYDIVGFAGFRLLARDTHGGGTESTLTGTFVTYVHQGAGGPPAEYFGAKSVSLVG